MRLRRVAFVAAAALVAVGCSGGPDPAADGQPDDGGTQAVPTSPGAGPTDPAQGQVEDGVFRGQGVVLPVPQGWQIDQAGLAQGVVGALPEGGQQQQFLVAIAGLNEAPGTQFEGMSLDEAVSSYRELAPAEPTVDEEIEFAGAERAHQLMFEDLEPEQGGQQQEQQQEQPPADQLIILSEDAEGQLALFNYVAPSDGFDEAIADQLRSEGGLDPDSEPTRPAPSPPAPTEGGEGEAQPSATPS